MALCLVPLYGVISLKEKNVEIFNNINTDLMLLFRITTMKDIFAYIFIYFSFYPSKNV